MVPSFLSWVEAFLFIGVGSRFVAAPMQVYLEKTRQQILKKIRETLPVQMRENKIFFSQSSVSFRPVHEIRFSTCSYLSTAVLKNSLF